MGAEYSLLIVEDERVLSSCLKLHFTACGMDVLVANTLAQARNLLESHEFDGFVLDVGLPDGDGLSLLASGDVAVERSIVITANPDTDRLSSFGVMHLIPKPIDLDHVERVLVRLAIESAPEGVTEPIP